MQVEEQDRLEKLLSWERRLWSQDCRMVAGVDEAGRGSLAGPVVAAAVITNDGQLVEGVNDSKKLTPRKRELLYERIKKSARAVGIGMVFQDEIDSVNIYNATIICMIKALQNLPVQPERVLIDGMMLPEYPVPQDKILQGDSHCYSIAAASIIAKVTRDRLMCELDKVYPQYGFARHKGYGTREHMAAIREHRPCKIHRKTFHPVSEY